MLGKRQRGAEQQQQPGGAQAPPPAAAFMDGDNYPAEAYLALELLERRLALMRQQLHALQQPSAHAAQAARPSLRMPSLGRTVARRGGSGGLTPRSSSRYGLGRKDSGLQREYSLSKRRRTQEYDAGEVLGAPKFVERAQVRGRAGGRAGAWW